MASDDLFLVVGAGADADDICRLARGGNQITIFPLTAAFGEISELRSRLLAAGYSHVEVIDSARRVDMEVTRLRGEIGPWLAKLANRQIEGMALKDYLQLPGLSLSAWWLSLIAERNTLKTSVFLRLAQVSAVERALAISGCNKCLIALEDARMVKTLATICRDMDIVELRVSTRARGSLAARVRLWLREGSGIVQWLAGALAWARMCYRVWQARHVLGRPIPPAQAGKEALLFVSYFPSFEHTPAKCGVFRNKYAIPLQDKLQRLGRPIIWLMVYANLHQTPYRQALVVARRFADAGERILMLEQYCGLLDCLRVLGFYIWVARRGAHAYRQLKTAWCGPFPAAAEPLWQSLWQASFCGSEAVHGLFFAIAFRRALAGLAQNTRDCLYYCEMLAWEKALCVACATAHPPLRSIGFLHTSVPLNFWPYFLDPTETARLGSDADLPLPTTIAAGGSVAQHLLAPAALPHVLQVESVRYLYLNGLAQSAMAKATQPTLLVAGSIDRVESLALLHLLFNMGQPPAGFSILFKGHPSLPLAPLIAELAPAGLPAGFEIRDEDLYGALKAAWAALVPASTTALEALAYGCTVIAPIFPDAMQMNPLADFPNRCKLVATPDELRMELAAVAAAGPPDAAAVAAGCSFINQYWNLDPGLPAWESLLATEDKDQ